MSIHCYCPVVSNVMFYHRAYDFAVLILPCIYLIEHWKQRGVVIQGVKFLTAANIIFRKPVFAFCQHFSC